MWSKSRPALFLIVRIKMRHRKKKVMPKAWVVPVPLFVAKDLIESFGDLAKFGERLFPSNPYPVGLILQTVGEMIEELQSLGRFNFLEVLLDDIAVHIDLY